jgi:hypothetical protein
MGAIFPMASERARLGFVRKREREAKRAAKAAVSAAVVVEQPHPLASTPSPKVREP